MPPSALAQTLMNRTFSGIGREVGQNIEAQDVRNKRQIQWDQQQADRQRVLDAIKNTPDFIDQLAQGVQQTYGQKAQELGVPLPDPTLFQVTGTEKDIATAKEFAEQVAAFRDKLDKAEQEMKTKALEEEQVGKFQTVAPEGQYPRGEVARAIGAPATPRVQKMLESYPTTEPRDYSFQQGFRQETMEQRGLEFLAKQRKDLVNDMTKMETQVRQLQQLQKKLEKGEMNPFLNPADNQALQEAGFSIEDFNSGRVDASTVAQRRADLEVQASVLKDQLKENQQAEKEFRKAPAQGLVSAINRGEAAVGAQDQQALETVRQEALSIFKSNASPELVGGFVAKRLQELGIDESKIGYIANQLRRGVGIDQLTFPGQSVPSKPVQGTQKPAAQNNDPLGIL